jgi:hypothetical protein
MAVDEEMAVRFYQKGNPKELADQLVTILQSPELQRAMAERNYAAGVQMTMASVVRNYLRWFELHRCRKVMREAGILPGRRRIRLRTLFSRVREEQPEWMPHSGTGLPALDEEAMDDRNAIDSADERDAPVHLPDPLAWRTSGKSHDHGSGDEFSSSPRLEGDF